MSDNNHIEKLGPGESLLNQNLEKVADVYVVLARHISFLQKNFFELSILEQKR